MSTLMSLLSVQGDRPGRSKSPSGRDRSRSRSNVRESKSEGKGESDRRKSTKSRTNNDSGSEEDARRYSERRSSKKYNESDSEDDRRKRRSSRKLDSPDGESEKYRSSKSKEIYESSSKRSSRPRSDSESSSDSREARRPGYGRSNSDVRPNIVTASPASASAKAAPSSAMKQPVNVQSPYGQPNAYSYAPPPGHVPSPPGAFPERPHGALSETRHMSYVGPDPRYSAPSQAYAPRPDEFRPRAASSTGQQYAQVGQFQYAQIDPRIAHKDPSAGINMYNTPLKPQVMPVDPRRSDSRILDAKHSEDVYSSRDREKSKRYSEDTYKARERESDRRERIIDVKPPKDDDKGASRRLSRLSIGAASGAATLGVLGAGHHGAGGDNGRPPPSPLLEAYTGTYQSISPLPSALVLADHKFDSDISDVELDSGSSSSTDDPHASRQKKIKRLEKERQWIQKKKDKEEKEPVEYERRRPGGHHYETRAPDDFASSVASSRPSRKKVNFYDAEKDAKEIAAALKGSKPPNIKPLLHILPHLSIDDLDALKAEYKKHATINGQGINMSKHIKARCSGHLGKAAYACSLGQYESDAYWANCFYQSGASRRELLIESLMGRTNQQIREIKNFFKDKKYDDDLEKCLKTELKADKFRTAILLALEERRQAESPVLDGRLIRHDVQDLYEALNGPGGESTMMQIIIVRSDTHLREMLRQYETVYKRNFARDMIHKSRNLVGETLAHILNGALNRSMRDALLLHQAIAEMAPGKERAELLMSRLVRLHWEPKHFEKVKAQYRQKYGIKVDDAIRNEIQSHMKTEEGIAWTNFCIELVRSSEQ